MCLVQNILQQCVIFAINKFTLRRKRLTGKSGFSLVALFHHYTHREFRLQLGFFVWYNLNSNKIFYNLQHGLFGLARKKMVRFSKRLFLSIQVWRIPKILIWIGLIWVVTSGRWPTYTKTKRRACYRFMYYYCRLVNLISHYKWIKRSIRFASMFFFSGVTFQHTSFCPKVSQTFRNTAFCI